MCQRAIGVGVVSLTMSLSISFTVAITHVYNNTSVGCGNAPHCWRNYCRVFALCCGAAFAVGTFMLSFVAKPKPAVLLVSHLQE